MTNVFADVAQHIRQNKVVILFFLASLTMLLIGINHFYEDTLSSLYGIQELETIFGINPASHSITYWSMSLAPQVAQVVFIYMFLVNPRKNRWALVIAIAALLMDFVADAWYRSNGQFLSNPGAFLAACSLTLVYFTVGSEMFVTVGLGLTLELLGPAVSQTRDFIESTMSHVRPKGGKPRKGGPSRTSTPVRMAPGGFPEGHPLEGQKVRKVG